MRSSRFSFLISSSIPDYIIFSRRNRTIFAPHDHVSSLISIFLLYEGGTIPCPHACHLSNFLRTGTTYARIPLWACPGFPHCLSSSKTPLCEWQRKLTFADDRTPGFPHDVSPMADCSKRVINLRYEGQSGFNALQSLLLPTSFTNRPLVLLVVSLVAIHDLK